MNTDALAIPNLNDKSLRYLLVLATSFMLATVASQLLEGDRFGLDFVVLGMCCLAAIYAIRQYCQQPLSEVERGLMVVGGVLIMLLVFRSSLVLYWLNLLGITTVLCLAFSQRYTGEITDIPAVAWLKTPFNFIRLLWLCVIDLLAFGYVFFFSGMRDRWHLRSIALGLLWASPIVLVFGSLLASADSRFEMFATELFSFDLSSLFKTLLDYLIYWPLTAAFLYAAVLGSEIEAVQQEDSPLRIEGVQQLTILVCVNLLFFSYIIVQFGYFFGGNQLVMQSDGLTYSSYARSGFWELIWLAMITISLLLSGHWLQRNEEPNIKIWFNRLAGIMICAVVVMEASAAHRMYLYIKIYGLTELRFYSSVFMVYIVCGLVAFFLTVLRGYRGRYIATMASQAIVFILLLNAANPDSWIAYNNLGRGHIKNLDNVYLAELSTDALPTIYSARKALPVEVSCSIQQRMGQQLPSNTEWYQWNWSLNRAHDIMSSWQHECREY